MKMTESDIMLIIRNCEARNDFASGLNLQLPEVICRDLCLPCLKVIDLGKCPQLIELAQKGAFDDTERES